jgi:6-pyruvoyltetrahydropterin/6-carboxytetrahydropterin synthase
MALLAMPIIAFTRRYAMAHRLLSDGDGKCATPHGHNELVTVQLKPLTPMVYGGDNRAAPFAALKQRWHEWIDHAVDHAFQVNAADPLIAYFRAHEPARLARLMVFPGDPTTEALAACFWLKLSAFLKADGLAFEVAEVRVEETPTNTVILTREIFEPTTCGLPTAFWARRGDLTINDFTS